MSRKMKYVIIDGPLCALPIVFSEFQQHANVAHAFGATPDKVIGAGFCQLTIDESKGYAQPLFVCYGESISLKVQSRGDEDSNFLNKYFGVVEY